MLKLQNLYKSYPVPGHTDKVIFKGLSLECKVGEAHVIMGSNGIGKTTLFNLISGFQRPDYGSIQYFDGKREYPLHRLSPAKIAQKGISRSFQHPHVFQKLSVFDNLCILPQKTPGEGALSSLWTLRKTKLYEEKLRSDIRALISLFLGKYSYWEQKLEKAAGLLSYGEQRLVEILRLMLGNSKVWLLDEPCSGINPRILEKLLHILTDYCTSHNILLLMNEHNQKFVEQLSAQKWLLLEGKLIPK